MRNIWLNQVRHAHSGPQFVDIDGEQEQNAVTHAKSSDDPHAWTVMSRLGKRGR
jgi:ABC-type Zn uptake system ZnuABC Zn-binding protein ZnuA